MKFAKKINLDPANDNKQIKTKTFFFFADVQIIGDIPSMTYGQAMSLDIDTGTIYIVGGWDNSNGRVVKIQIPTDLCSLWSSRKSICRHFMGCSYCAIKPLEEYGSHCYSNGKNDVCNTLNGTLVFNKGADCDDAWIMKRNCSTFTSCSSCLAYWPSHGMEKTPACQWCEGCDNKCVSWGQNCTGNADKCSIIPTTTVDECLAMQCAATDCDSCNAMSNCSWTFNGQTHQCIADSLIEGKKVDVVKLCPSKCGVHKNCSSCLGALSSEGGWDECHWSTQLNECISPSYQPLYCTGGVCALILTPDEKENCPEPCDAYDQCQTCLRHAHCGWCSKSNTDGEGVCTEGSLADYPARSTCDVIYAKAKNTSIAPDDRFTWNYVKCPPENECNNGHHNCDPKSETCFDLNFGFECRCAEGFALEEQKCVPVCKQGCVHGRCVEPDRCDCDFGYVGVNCSIQCQCNGHANCAGPDKLDECGECHNNTMGAQCEKCKKWYVKSDKNGDCIPCNEYCNGHSDLCVPADRDDLKFKSRSELEFELTEGVVGEAVCLDCQNKTDGEQCDTCINGFFRGTYSKQDACRPCHCNGHGDTCDPITGEKCNCGNNTESDPTCTAKTNKNSVYPCWNVQCAKCRDSYAGHPTDSHQCYKQITVESKMCFDAKNIGKFKLINHVLVLD